MGGNTILSCIISSHLANRLDLQPRFFFLVHFWRFLKHIKITLLVLHVQIPSVVCPCCRPHWEGAAMTPHSLITALMQPAHCFPSEPIFPRFLPHAMLPRNVSTGDTGELLLYIISKLSRKQQACARCVWSCLNHICIVIQRHPPNYKTLELRLDKYQINKMI